LTTTSIDLAWSHHFFALLGSPSRSCLCLCISLGFLLALTTLSLRIPLPPS
jgi:hypothetical protein